MKLPNQTLPPDFAARVQASPEAGLPFSWGSDDTINLDDPRLTDAQRSAITALALRDTPLGVSTSDAARFLGQQGMPLDLTTAGVGGGMETPGAGATPGGRGGQSASNPDANIDIGPQSPGFSMPDNSLVGPNGSLIGPNGLISFSNLGQLAGGSIPIPGVNFAASKVLGRAGSWLDNLVFSPTPHVTPTPQIDPFSEEQDPNMPDMPNVPDFSLPNAEAPSDVDPTGTAAGSPSAGAPGQPSDAGPGPGPGAGSDSGGDSGGGGGGEGGLRRGGRVPARSLMPTRGFKGARKFRQGGYVPAGGGDSGDIGAQSADGLGLGTALDFLSSVSSALRAPSCGPGGGYSRGGPVLRSGAVAPRAPESERAARARRVRAFELRHARTPV
jgi:hypothetical protein